jgi:hypothetical protein
MFSERASGEGLLFVGNNGRGPKVVGSVAEGDNVCLMIGKEIVQVGDVKAVGPGMYRGTIVGFQSSVEEFQGYSQGQSVVFTEKQIFECCKP